MSTDPRLDAIEQTYRSGYADFVRTASAIANSHEAGRDAVHDAFVAAIRRRRTYRNEGTLEAWLWRIVVRSALRNRRTPVEHPSADEAADAVWLDDPTGRDDVRAALGRLPERQRLMLFLRYYGDLDYRTIASLTGVRVGTVGAELHAAHRSLRRHLEEAPHHA